MIRSILFATLAAVAIVFVALYVLVSLPSVQQAIKGRLEREASDFLGASVTARRLEIMPFNEVRLSGVKVLDPQGARCLDVERLAAGISLWQLVKSHRIVITYAELIGMDAHIWQKSPHAPLNIQFIVDAFKPKDRNKPPAKFDMTLHNIVIRNSKATFDRVWLPRKGNGRFDPNHIAVSKLRADVALPRIANDDFTIDLRRLALLEQSGLDLNTLSLKAHITQNEIELKDILIKLPNSTLSPSDITLPIERLKRIKEALHENVLTFSLDNATLTPSDLSAFFPALAQMNYPLDIDAGLRGNMKEISIERLRVSNMSESLQLNLAGDIHSLDNVRTLNANIRQLNLRIPRSFLETLAGLLPASRNVIDTYVSPLGDIKLEGKGVFDLDARIADADISLTTSQVGDIDLKCSGGWKSASAFNLDFNANSDGFSVGSVLPNSGIGKVALSAEGKLAILSRDIQGNMAGEIRSIDFNGVNFSGVKIEAEKMGKDVKARIASADPRANVKAEATAMLDGAQSHYTLTADVESLYPSLFIRMPKQISGLVQGRILADVSGNSIDNVMGSVMIRDLNIAQQDGKSLRLDRFDIDSFIEDAERRYTLDTDFATAHIQGDIRPSVVVPLVKDLAMNTLPSLLSKSGNNPLLSTTRSKMATRQEPISNAGNLTFTMELKPESDFLEHLNLPVRPLSPVTLAGVLNSEERVLSASIDAPYLLQGKNKLIRNSTVDVSLSELSGAKVNINTIYPLKNDDAGLGVSISALNDHLDGNINWTMQADRSNKGNILLAADLSRNQLTRMPEATARILPGDFHLNGEEWKIYPANVHYAEGRIDVRDLKIQHAAQFIDIGGTVSPSPEDMLRVDLAGIDLNYIFDILNINYVNFGGVATGTAVASQLLSGAPVLATDGLHVHNLSYNNALLGDALLESHWDNTEKMVAINADIADTAANASARVRGGVYVTRDSLSFDFDANHINAELVKPFMSAFTSDVRGRATGKLRLAGTFSDIDLLGKIHADTLSMLCDFTGVTYHTSGDVTFDPGKITIPKLRVFDKYGNSGWLEGVVTHRYLHDASFDFNLTDARNLLSYDTRPSKDEFWYGRVFASGNGSIKGAPGIVTIDINMTTAPKSNFTFELSESQTAEDYTFLTFSDKQKEAMEVVDVEETFEEKFRRKITTESGGNELFALNLGLKVTPDITLNLIMDPKAGDKIVAHGQGAIRMEYNNHSDNFDIYGKYTIDHGTYNFSLQELILRNFKIEPGSNISFNGDPMRGILDIVASYRVNTNLTDLDKSFESDPDLNRTSIPVDALLNVKGDIQAPDISFDVRFPTVTADVGRKVKSIISTVDMMNRQMIYLLVLNRFYSPEYSGGEGQGGELASVASSTISGQIQNIIGSLTDKFTLSPQFRSERSDFSDIGVDVALSSKLFDNRLLINGNLGYRDKSTSQTTFIGDFDIEYLLNRNGSLRLKAYNHFNDASYYLKSALTTQGLGIVYKKDFDNPFRWLRPKKRKRPVVNLPNADKQLKGK